MIWNPDYKPKHRKSAHNHPPHLMGDKDTCPACAEEHAELVRRGRSGMERERLSNHINDAYSGDM